MTIPRVIAHRGASAEAPENTIPAIDLAVELGAGGVELDVRLTEDDVPVLLHDRSVDRTTDGSGRVDRLPLEEIEDLDAGKGRGKRFRNTRVPTLGEVLDRFAGRVWLDLELKAVGGETADLVDAVGEALGDHGVEEGVLVSSFRPDLLAVAAERCPGIPLAQLVKEVPDDADLATLAEGVDALGLNRGAARPEVVDGARDLGVPVFAWTVNSPSTARTLYKRGVDGIVTDDPRRILRVSPP